MDSLLEKKNNDLVAMKRVIEEQLEIINKQELIVKTTAFAYINEALSILRDSIPRSFKFANFDFVMDYLVDEKDNKTPRTGAIDKYKLITWDLQDFLGLSAEPRICDYGPDGIYKVYFDFKLGEGIPYTYTLVFPTVFESYFYDTYSFRAYNHKEDYIKIVDNLVIKIERRNDDKVVSEATLTPDKVHTIKDVFRETIM